MAEEIEISTLDLRYESYRMKSKGTEKALLASIVEHGIRDPLQGADTNGSRILLDGFKRYRCAKHLGIAVVPYLSLGGDQPLAIITLLRISNAKSLSILEQAKLIDELKTSYAMSTGEMPPE
jgi:ParB-like chromosome segregation protein Spo0J